jgi:hypothetical protein
LTLGVFLFDALNNASVDPSLMTFEARSAFFALVHIAYHLLPTRIRVAETGLGPAVLLDLLALPAI